MIRNILKVSLLGDIWAALWIGLRCCARKGVTRKIKAIRAGDGAVRLNVSKKKCVACRMCEGICPCNGAISIKAPGRCVFNPARCSFCRLCQRACPTEAISFVRSFTKANPRMKRSISKT